MKLFAVYFLLTFEIIFSQSLKEKIGQMVWVGFSGTKLNDTIKVDLAKRNIGGVILFANNISNPTQIKLLNDTIKLFAKTPPFIAVDQEGGKVARLNSSNGFSNTYTAYQLGTIFNSEDSTRKTARTMANWLKQTGFNVNLAPVADVNVNPNSPAIGKLERSFSSIPINVFYHVNWFVDEFNKMNIITCLKHFPGHGSALQDSHLGFTDITNTWTENELLPYQYLINSNYNNLVMIGHLYNSKLDQVYPASLSKKVTTDLLRTSLGFNGVTITDGMSMQAITANYTFDQSIELAVNAGNDILLFTGTLRLGTSLASQIIDIIESKVIQGKISPNRIEESYQRIKSLKMKNGIITSNEIANEIPNDFVLYQNYPNPFNPSTVISYQISNYCHVILKVYDVLGREVATLLDEYKQPGLYNYQFSIMNYQLPSGVYFYQMRAGNFVQTKKMILLR